MAGLGFEMRAIDAVAQQRMADMGEVHPDLMGAPGLELAGQERRDRLALAPVEGFLDLPMGNGLAAAFAHRPFLSGMRMPVDRRVDGAALAGGAAPYRGHVGAPPPSRGALVR